MSWLSTYFPDLRPIVWHAIILKSPLLAHSGLSWLFLDDVRKRSVSYTTLQICPKVSEIHFVHAL